MNNINKYKLIFDEIKSDNELFEEIFLFIFFKKRIKFFKNYYSDNNGILIKSKIENNNFLKFNFNGKIICEYCVELHLNDKQKEGISFISEDYLDYLVSIDEEMRCHLCKDSIQGKIFSKINGLLDENEWEILPDYMKQILLKYID